MIKNQKNMIISKDKKIEFVKTCLYGDNKQSEKKIKTEAAITVNENKEYIVQRFNEIKKKYSSKNLTTTTNNNNINNSSSTNYMKNQTKPTITILREQKSYNNIKEVAKTKNEHTYIYNRPQKNAEELIGYRIQNINKINDKIKNLLQQQIQQKIKKDDKTQIQRMEKLQKIQKLQKLQKIKYVNHNNNVSSLLDNQFTSQNQNMKFLKTIQTIQTDECQDIQQIDQSRVINRLFYNTNLKQQEQQPIELSNVIMDEDNNNYNESNESESKKLIKRLATQVKLDQIFRNQKYSFKINTSANKWQLLQYELNKINIKVNSKEEIENLFKIREEEYNPFSITKQNISYEEVALSYKNAEEHWNTKILHMFTKSILKKEGFNQNKLNLQKNSLISVEDLVRLLNFELECYFRNRDLILIFRRLQKESSQKLSFPQFLKVLCYDN